MNIGKPDWGQKIQDDRGMIKNRNIIKMILKQEELMQARFMKDIDEYF